MLRHHFAHDKFDVHQRKHLMNTQVIVALDVSSPDAIEPIIQQIPKEIDYFKVGLELFCAQGPSVLSAISSRGKKLFLDLKLHDIPRTVARAVQSASKHNVQLLTVHACGGKQMLKDAAQAARDLGPDAPKLLAVTALTSLDADDLIDLGIQRTPADHVLRMAELALSCGMDGLVSSPQEVKKLRDQFGPNPILVTPGIRLPTGPAGDQKRTGSPAQAVRDGSSYLVIGRPILDAPDPAAAARAILQDMQSAG
jgi:orotidine-5'-phosphate decarboxylase